MITLSIQEIATLVDGNLILNNASKEDMVRGVCIDSRHVEEGNLYVPLLGERVDGHTFIKDVIHQKASLVFCSDSTFLPDDIAVIEVEDTLVALQQLAHNYRKRLSCTVIGITGSNGKTSCKDILAGALSAKFKTQKTQGNKNNEIGVPLTLLSLDYDCEMAVIEMGMENREEIHFLNGIVEQDIAIVTNVGVAHLENLGSLENIGKAKLEIVDGLKDGALFTYFGDDAILSKLMKVKQIQKHIEIKTFGNGVDNDSFITSLKQDETGIYFTTNASDFEYHIHILGAHQAVNALAAIVVAKHLGMSETQIQTGFHCIKNTSMRNELMHIGRCTILNDAYKSNPQSAQAALDTFQAFAHEHKIIVLADMLDLGVDSAQLHYDLGCSLVHYDAEKIICMGEEAKEIARGAKLTCANKEVVHVTTREEVFEEIKDAINHDCMLLFKGSRGMALDLVIEMMKEQEKSDE